jgi:hypothetical protein
MLKLPGRTRRLTIVVTIVTGAGIELINEAQIFRFSTSR